MGRKKLNNRLHNINDDIIADNIILFKKKRSRSTNNKKKNKIQMRDFKSAMTDSDNSEDINSQSVDKKRKHEVTTNNVILKKNHKRKKKKRKIRYQNIDKGLNVSDIKISKRKEMERERELKRKQLTTVPSSKKLRPDDIHRIVLHTNCSIFNEENCCLWTGYITNLKNKRKGTYINFYFRDKKKVALHRLLYANFKGDICSKDYIKYSCSNKGKCCNINHMVKFEYNSNDKEDGNTDSDLDSEESEESEEETFKIIIY